jgi:ferric-dicitrate binding protein FerR (iron transport regulator)
MNKDIIKKFINNQCTEAELAEVFRWVNAEALSKDFIDLGIEEWMHYPFDENAMRDEKFSSLFDKIQKKIDQNTQRSEKSGPRVKSTASLLTWITRAAAVMLLPVLGFLFYTLSVNKMNTSQYPQMAIESFEIVAPIGSRTVVHLSDGSEVHLNYGSRLIYPQVFTGDLREVELYGEGFFEVAHDPEKPFAVKTGGLTIKALGTSFNVNAYPDAEHVETTLVNGKVVIEKSEENGNKKTIGSMVPGQHVSYHIKTGVVASSRGGVEKYIAWKSGKMVFEDASILYVADRLSRMFNVDIEVKDNVKDYLYTVTFVDEPLSQILDLMAIATPLKYRVLPRKKLPDGTFTKQKIFIEKR